MSRDAGVVADYAADPLNHHGKVPARTPGLIVSFVEFMLAVLPLIRLLLLVTHGPHDRLAGVAGRQMVVDRTCAQYDAFKVYDGLSKEIFNQLPQDREIVRREFGEWVRARVAP